MRNLKALALAAALAGFLFSLPNMTVIVDSSVASEAVFVAETRCGWFHNPTPGNAWLIDAAGEWTISAQGGYQAEGDWPNFSDARWVKTNVNYGYGCSCMKVTTDRRQERVIRIISSYSRALSACRKDRAIKGKEPK